MAADSGVPPDTHDVTLPAGPIAWPEGYTAAATLGFDMDSEDVALTVDPESRHRLSAMSHQAYGALTGVPRVLDLLKRHDVRATFFCPGYTAERYPDVLRRVRDEGHEIAHHGYLHEAMAGMSREQEASVLDRGLEALDRIAGVRPVGYRAPQGGRKDGDDGNCCGNNECNGSGDCELCHRRRFNWSHVP